MTGHRETRVAVNVWVDCGVVPLVEALNAFPQIQTMDSCECGSDGNAYVMFGTYDDTDLYETTNEIAQSLSKMDDCPATLSIAWWYGGTTPTATLSCAPDAVPAVANAVRLAAPVRIRRLVARLA